MNYEIDPYVGVGQIKFGSPVDEVRGVVGEAFRSFLKSPRSVFPTDSFPALRMFCFYDAQGLLEAVEFAKPARPIICGFEFIGQPLSKAIATLGPLDSQLEIERDGLTAYGLGVALWAPLAKNDPHAPIEAVMAFRRGYYD